MLDSQSPNLASTRSEKTRAQRLKRRLQHYGLRLGRCRSRTPEIPGYGNYWVVSDDNIVVFGAHPHAFSASLEDWLREEYGT